MTEPLTRVDSAVQGLEPDSPLKEKFNRIDSGVHDLDLNSPTDDKRTRRDSAIEGLEPVSPVKDKPSHRRKSSSAAKVHIPTIKDLEKNRTPIQVAIETQGTGWKINTSPTSVDDKELLTKPLVTPIVKNIELVFPLGSRVTIRNTKEGLLIKDALDAIHKHNKNRADDELTEPYLKGFEWSLLNTYKDVPAGKDELEAFKTEWCRLYIHQSSTPGVSSHGGSKKKKNKHADAA
ncbi:hypothetical protein M426DRAFT_18016 [Hypoxylon sp. CI-4A]|nr:hypothetical protein M426DRAFT_18016 [Hypoxylon sp. CI-4A]